MRTATSNGITINYPDAIGFAFNVCLIQITGEFSYAVASIGDVSLTVSSYGGKAYADIQELVQSEFDATDYSVAYSQTAEKTAQGKSLNIGVAVYDDDDSQLYQLSFTTFYVWGAMYSGETYNAYRQVMYFPGWPFTFGMYTNGEQGKIMVANDGRATSLIDVNGEGVYNFTIPDATAKDYYDIYDMKSTFTETTFDDTYDLTFRMKFTGQQTLKMRLLVCRCDMEHPVYLRWIDRHGFWQHFLFKKGEEKRSVSADGEFIRNNLQTYDGSYGMAGAVGRRQSYGREDSMAVCAPLVDAEMFDFLQGVASSPVVDMYLPEDERWLSVTVKEGTYTKTGDTLQDFELEIVKLQYQIQRL